MNFVDVISWVLGGDPGMIKYGDIRQVRKGSQDWVDTAEDPGAHAWGPRERAIGSALALEGEGAGLRASTG